LGDELRILIATDSFLPQINGVSDTAAILARMLAASGHNVEVLAPGPGPDRCGRAVVHRARSIPLPLYAHLRLAAPLTTLPAILRRNPPDATVVLTPGPIGLSVTGVVRSPTRLIHIFTTDIPHYLHSYGLAPLRPPVLSVLRWMSNRSEVTLCPTDYVRTQLALRGHPRLGVWGRGVDTTLFNPTKYSAEMRWRLTGGEPEKPLVLYVGRLAREKGLLNLYEAAQLVPGVRFALVGDGPLRGLLERRFANVPSVFAGFLRGEPLASAYASADAFVFPSESETFGQVVLQAMASGVPPIVVRGTAPAEFVRAGESGLHVAPRSPGALAEAMQRLTKERDLRRMLAAGAERDAAKFSWGVLVERLVRHMRTEGGELEPEALTVS
jgi:glycosyltransferase involved in cell wall biosynthesis